MDDKKVIEILEDIKSDVNMIWSNTSSANDVSEISDVKRRLGHTNDKLDKIIALLEDISEKL